jgi:hypothetical protein
LTTEEMIDLYRRVPLFVEQLRAKVIKAMADGDQVIAAHARKVHDSRPFLMRVRAFGRNELPYLDLYDMLALFAVMVDIEEPRLKRLVRGTEKNGRRPGAGFPRPKKLIVHPGLADD